MGKGLSIFSPLIVLGKHPLCWVVSCGKVSSLLDFVDWELRNIRLCRYSLHSQSLGSCRVFLVKEMSFCETPV